MPGSSIALEFVAVLEEKSSTLGNQDEKNPFSLFKFYQIWVKLDADNVKIIFPNEQMCLYPKYPFSEKFSHEWILKSSNR